MMFVALHKSPILSAVQLHNRAKSKRGFFRKDNKARKALERGTERNTKPLAL